MTVRACSDQLDHLALVIRADGPAAQIVPPI
jgi:hypothetical protein